MNKKETQLCYSTDQENYYADIEDALEDYVNAEYEVPPTVKVWVANSKPYAASDLYPRTDFLLDELRDRAFDECMEWSENWLNDTTPEQENDLEAMMKATLDKWADKHNLQPDFFSVEKPHTILTVLMENYEVVKEEKLCG